MRRGARWLLVGAALMAMAPSGAYAKVRAIELNACSGCLAPAIDGPPEGDAAAGGASDADDPGRDPMFDPNATPTVTAGGLPSAPASAGLKTQGARGPSPYGFFADVIPLPLGVRAGFAAASLFLFAPLLIGRLTLTDILSHGHARSGPPPRPAM